MSRPRCEVTRRRFLQLAGVAAGAGLLGGCRRPAAPHVSRRIHLTYWEKWTGDDAAALRQVVDGFNRSQDHVTVEYLNVSQIDRKVLVATAGGSPPDVAGLWGHNIAAYADEDALIPLDTFIDREASGRAWLGRLYPVLAEMVTYGDRVFAMPTLHQVTAFYWNRTMFREAGLSGEEPPRTLEEFDEACRRLAHRDAKSGRLTQAGLLLGIGLGGYLGWHGGRQFDGRELTLLSSPGNLAALEWIQRHVADMGLAEYRAFATGVAGSSVMSFSSPQNPFFSGRVAMVLTSAWFYGYMQRLAPGLDHGCMRWPVVTPGVTDYTSAGCDIVIIPRGSRHPEAAWEFIRYLCSNNPQAETPGELAGLERAAWQMRRISPLREWSPVFAREHPNPDIALFRELSETTNANFTPKFAIAREYESEMATLIERVALLGHDPLTALTETQRRLEQSWHQHQRTVARYAGS